MSVKWQLGLCHGAVWNEAAGGDVVCAGVAVHPHHPTGLAFTRCSHLVFVTCWAIVNTWDKGEREMFYLTTHSTHFIYGYMASDIWLRTILIVRKETCCLHIGFSFRLTARVLLYASSHRQNNTYHSLRYTSRGALAGTRNSSMGMG